jgi:hypothetical protein
MKYVIITGVVVVVGLGVLMWGDLGKIEVINPEPEVVEKEVRVDALEEAVKDAQEAQRTEIEATAKRAYDEAYNQEMKKVELEVIKSFNEKLEVRQIELEKETKVY